VIEVIEMIEEVIEEEDKEEEAVSEAGEEAEVASEVVEEAAMVVANKEDIEEIEMMTITEEVKREDLTLRIHTIEIDPQKKEMILMRTEVKEDLTLAEVEEEDMKVEEEDIKVAQDIKDLDIEAEVVIEEVKEKIAMSERYNDIYICVNCEEV